jgi:quercetin dioxygenase-like cupin family protein
MKLGDKNMSANFDPVLVAGDISQPILENERVRILKATFKPNEKAEMHHHPDHVIYVLKGGKMKITSEGQTNILDLKENQAMFLKEQNHVAENIGDTTVDMLVVELK